MKLLLPWSQQPLFLLQARVLTEKETFRVSGRTWRKAASTTGLIQLDKCGDLKLLSHKQFPHLWLVTWSHLKPQMVFFRKDNEKMIQEKHRWTNRSCLFWLPAIRTWFHPSLKRGSNIPNSLTSFCLESHARAFQTECILAYSCYKCDRWTCVHLQQMCVLMFIWHRI